MSYISDLIGWLLDLLRNPGPHLATLGLWGMAAIIFVETGLLFPFLPGDSLLVVAGIYAAKGDLNLWILLPVLTVAAILGDAFSYYLGRKTGPKIFNRPRSRFFRPEYVEKAHAFYEKHGGFAIVISRFMPIVRTYVPVIAGIAQMPYRKFGFYNVIGGVSWILSMSLLGYFMGDFASARGFPLEKHIEKVIIVVVFLSIAPGIWAWWRERSAAKKSS